MWEDIVLGTAIWVLLAALIPTIGRHREQNEKADLPHGHHDRYRPSCNNKRLRLTRILVERCPLLVHRGGVVHYRLSAISLGCERGRSLTRLAVWWVALGVDGTVETHLSGRVLP